MRKISGRFGAVAVITALIGMMLAAASAAPAQTFEKLVDLSGPNGINPYYGSLVQGRDGNLYGTTGYGGLGSGTVFKLTPDGVQTTIYKFCSAPNCTDGDYPNAGLVLGAAVSLMVVAPCSK